MSAACIALEMDSLPATTRLGPAWPARGNRVLPAAALASVVLHAVALGWLPGLERMVERAPLPLRILLPVPADSRPETPSVPAVAPAPTVVARSAARPPTPALRAVADESVPAPAVGIEEPPPVAHPVKAAAPAAPDTVAPVPTLAVTDLQALAGFGRSVAAALASHQRYPRIAQMRQWQGTTMLQLEFAADGRLLETRVLSSSGHDVLDQQALDMLRAARPLPPPPVALAGRPLVVHVPVVFRLAG